MRSDNLEWYRRSEPRFLLAQVVFVGFVAAIVFGTGVAAWGLVDILIRLIAR